MKKNLASTRRTLKRNRKKRSRNPCFDLFSSPSKKYHLYGMIPLTTFCRNARNMTAEKAAAEAEEARKREEEAEEQRKLASKELAGESIRRELVESTLVFSSPSLFIFFPLTMFFVYEQRKQPILSPKSTIPTVSTSKPNLKHGAPVNSLDSCVKSKPKQPRMKRRKRLRGDERCQRSKGSRRIWNLQPERGRRKRGKWGSCKSITTRVHSIRSVCFTREKML